MNSDRRLVQTLINTLCIEKAKEAAGMAAKFGSDWVGVGTPLMYSCGLINVIPAVREITGDIPVVADIKVHDGGGFFPVKAKEYGADYCTVSTRMNYSCCREAVRVYHECGIKIIGDLCTVPESEVPHYVAELQNIGVQTVCIHYTEDEAKYYSMFRRAWDGVSAAKGVARIPVGCVVRSFDEIRHALDDGADWIAISGGIVDNGSEDGYAGLKKAIDMVHDYRPAGRQP
jgi:3-keto-L-gulonate-6-phosphate decarboxylase